MKKKTKEQLKIVAGILIIILIICYLQNIGIIENKIIPDTWRICQYVPGIGGGDGGGGGGDNPPGTEPGDELPECIDPDILRLDGGIWVGTTTTGLLSSGTDSCNDITYLREYYCDPIGNVLYRVVDCTSYGAWCHPTSGSCEQMGCIGILSPKSQADCDDGSGCNQDQLCRFVSGGIMGTNKCECSVPTTCQEACLFEGYTIGWCSEIMQRNPCGLTGTSFMDYKELCGGYFSDETCCCS